MGRVPTIRDVARACGLSHMTVSNVMNDRPVSEATRKQVLEAMRVLNYQPSAIARGLNRKPMDTLGVVLANSYQSPTSHPYYAPVLDGIMATAVALRKDVTVYTGSLWTEDGDGLRRYRDGRSDGLLLLTPAMQLHLVRALLEVRIPFVIIGNYYEGNDASSVGADDGNSMTVLVDHLVGLGHSRIVYWSGHEDGTFTGPRVTGFRKAVERRGLPLDESSVLYVGFTRPKIQRAAEMVASQPLSKRPTAICLFNDEMALIAIEELTKAGVRIPEDISVTGFDDSLGAAEVELTTIRNPMRKIGMRAAEVLAAMLRGEISQPVKELFETELVVRRTTGPPKLAAKS